MATYSENDDIGQSLLKKADSAFSDLERTNVENLWSELAEFIIPSLNSKFNGNSTKGDKKDRRIFDNTAPNASRDLASALHSTLTNPASKWSKLRFRESALNNPTPAAAWLSHATNEIHNSLSDSNFDNQIGRGYQSYCALGTMVLLHDEVNEQGKFKKMNFAAWHLAEIAYSENYLGVVDTIYRKFKLTIRNAYTKFGDALGQDIIDKLDKKPNEELDFVHAIYPRDKKDIHFDPITGLAAPIDRPFASCYIMRKGAKLVLEDGYYEFPVYVSRWLTLPGEIYGYGPGHVARADVLTINMVVRTLLKGLAKAVDPVIIQTQNNLLTGDFRPGRIAVANDINGIKEMVTQSRFDIGFMEAKELREAIKSAFYIDKLMLPPRTETGEMTAYEIQQRLEQMQVVLGPPLSRLNYELLQPLVMRSLGILIRAGKIPPIPQEVLAMSNDPETRMGNIDLDVAFVNSLARSQQMSEVKNINSWIQEAFQMAQMGKPEALDRVNADAAIEMISRIRDIPEELVLSDDQVAALQQQRQQQQQAQQALVAGESASGIAKNLNGIQGGGVQ